MRYERDQSYIDHIEAEVRQFIAEVDSMETKLRELAPFPRGIPQTLVPNEGNIG